MTSEEIERPVGNRGAAPLTLRNSEARWDEFAPIAYWDLNYRHMRHDDRRILHIIRDHFMATADLRRFGLRRAAAVDVGTGSNLYPAFAMTPFADRIFLYDLSTANVGWLTKQRRQFDESWLPFWHELAAKGPYRRVRSPRREFARKVHIERKNVFQLDEGGFDLGTMFFVAESLSTEEDEFVAAMHAFIGSLRPGAPFATAHMENSSGYEVDGVWFPAYAVKAEQIRRTLGEVASDVYVEQIPYNVDGALREGYDGMIVATGRAR
ncbi:SCO2525 family SAM-dependent methyltransferase [Cryptosporangium sp. NPDC051539]|uniref:SCO2525 family SAM-dependent methyltransferase n=1 Tax=Cryptosporangium sp. NPDC051539 TaxID=3363962 RepID=UPI003793CD2B